MISSKNLQLANDQVITATAISENVINLRPTGRVYKASADLVRSIGAGEPIELLVQATEVFATLTSLTITLESSAAVGLGSSRVHWSSGAVAAAALVVGYKVPIRFLPDDTYLQYLGLRFTIGGSNATTGKIRAGIVLGRQSA